VQHAKYVVILLKHGCSSSGTTGFPCLLRIKAYKTGTAMMTAITHNANRACNPGDKAKIIENSMCAKCSE